MCGIVGLLIRDPALRAQLGSLAVPMFACMAARGADSGGLAVFEPFAQIDPHDQKLKYSLFVVDRAYDWAALTKKFPAAWQSTPKAVEAIENHAVITIEVAPEEAAAWLKQHAPEVTILSVGKQIEVYKDSGHPADIAARFQFGGLHGTHLVAHTRMATESAVTPMHSHPFTAGQDFCLVHNGSLSNPHMLRRKLEKQGIRFESDNDTEAACRFLEWRMQQGDTIEEAVEHGFTELDGFFTLLMGTGDRLLLVRDAFACKPAVVAQTDQYVAISSEFRSLAHLPGIEHAELFEPQPEEIYSWSL